MKTSYKGTIALTLGIVEVAFWSIVLQVGGSRIGILPLLFYGFLIGSVASVALSLAMNRGRGLASIIRQPKLLGLMLLAGLLNDLFTQLFLSVGTLGTNPSMASILYRTWPIFVLLLTPLVLKHKVKRLQYLATAIGFFGVYIVASSGALFTVGVAQLPYVGVLILAALCSSSSILIMNRYNTDTAGAIAIFNVFSFAAIAILVLLTHTSINIVFTLPVILSLLFLGVVAYAAGTMIYYYAIKTLGSLVTGNAALAVPFLTIVFAFLLIGTPIETYYIIAALLISAGIILQRYKSVLPERITKTHLLRKVTLFDVTSTFISNRSLAITHQISGGSRAFAVRLNRGFDEKLHRNLFESRDCIVFTNKRPHPCITSAEINFINEIMGTKNDEVLIAMGDPKDLENAFADFVSMTEGRH